MSRVFISSVIGGMGQYREKAAEAIRLMGHEPVMSEQFGARAYSSEIACTHEVEQCDIYILLLGEQYGSKTPEGISVTHSEYNTARDSKRPILIFVQQVDMEEEQLGFKKDVEDFQQGYFRAAFSTPDELKDEVVKSLRQYEVMTEAAPQHEFEERVSVASNNIADNWDDKITLLMAFWPQPNKAIDIVGLESQLDNIFNKLCEVGLGRLRDGYETKTGDDWTGLRSGKIKYACFDDGLTIILLDPIVETDGLFSGYFVSPKILSDIVDGFWQMCDGMSGYVHIELLNMGNAYVSEPPSGSSLSMRFVGKDNLGFSKLFLPLTQEAYSTWTGQCLKRFERTFGYKDA